MVPHRGADPISRPASWAALQCTGTGSRASHLTDLPGRSGGGTTSLLRLHLVLQFAEFHETIVPPLPSGSQVLRVIRNLHAHVLGEGRGRKNGEHTQRKYSAKSVPASLSMSAMCTPLPNPIVSVYYRCPEIPQTSLNELLAAITLPLRYPGDQGTTLDSQGKAAFRNGQDRCY